MKTLFGALLVMLVAVPSFAADLFIDLRTNYEPGTDFSVVRVELIDRADARNQWVAIKPGRPDYLSGARVAELHNVETRHEYMMIVTLLDSRMRPVDGHISLLDMPATSFATTMLITRP